MSSDIWCIDQMLGVLLFCGTPQMASALRSYEFYLSQLVTTPYVVVVDGNNILYAPDEAAFRMGGKIPLPNIIDAIVASVQAKYPQCPLVIDIVFKGLPNYDPEDFLLALNHPTPLPVMVSYVDLMDWRRLGSQFREFDDYLTLKKLVAYSHILGPDKVTVLSCDGYRNFADTVTTVGRAEARLIERNYRFGGTTEYLHKPTVTETDYLRDQLDILWPSIARVGNNDILNALGFQQRDCSRLVSTERKAEPCGPLSPQITPQLTFSEYLYDVLYRVNANPRTTPQDSINILNAALVGNWNYIYNIDRTVV